jgi:hypothetical protein
VTSAVDTVSGAWGVDDADHAALAVGGGAGVVVYGICVVYGDEKPDWVALGIISKARHCISRGMRVE